MITGITANTNNYYIVRARDSAGTIDTNTSEKAALFNGLIRFIPLDSGTLTTGEKIGNATVTAVAAPSVTATDRRGIANNAYLLNGTSQYFDLNLSLPVAMPQGNTARTYCAWIRPSGLGSTPIIISQGDTGPVWLQFLGDPTALTVAAGGSVTISQEIPNILTSWNFVCMSYNIDKRLITLVNSNSNNTIIQTAFANTGSYGRIGATPVASPGNFFPGSISDVSIWNRALTAAEMLAVFRN
jgi:hypothetical protein